jgi:hypothetical protein
MFSGGGNPCAKIVDSNATIGFPRDKASETSGRIFSNEDAEDCDDEDE